jgi:hypothetical protein
MSEPKPPYASLAAGLVALLAGVLIELASNPIQPISYVPGMIFFPIPVGIGLAFLERKQKLAAMIAYYIVLVGTLFMIGRAETSILPLCLLISAYALSRFAFFFYTEKPEPKRKPRRY